MAFTDIQRPRVELFEPDFGRNLRLQVARVAVLLASDDPAAALRDLDNRFDGAEDVDDVRALLTDAELSQFRVARNIVQEIAELTFDSTVEPAPVGDPAHLIGDFLE